MNRNSTVLVWVLFILIFYSPSCLDSNRVGVTSFVYPQNFKSKKDWNSPYLKKIYTSTNVDSLPLPSFSKDMQQALKYQSKLLDIQRRGKKVFNIGGLRFTKRDLEETVDLLEKWGSTAFIPMSEYFDVYQISGKDQRGSVLFTGYYSPVLDVRSKPDKTYKYPIYSKPKGMSSYPTRKQIYKDKALAGKGLELAYAKSLLDIQSMQLQGSGYVQYEDGSKYLLSYGGGNGHARKSIQRYYQKNYAESPTGITLKTIEKYVEENPDKRDEIIFHNPSCIFFVKNSEAKKVTGSGHVPLKPFISIATDKRYIPTGSCLMASRPVPRKGGIDYKISLLLAQDVGGAIKGPGRLDLYTGIGEKGRKGTYLKDYGELWLLLAKRRT